MTAEELIELLRTVEPSTPVVMGGDDHSYVSADGWVGTALQEGRSRWTEDYGEERTPESVYGKRVNVVVIR